MKWSIITLCNVEMILSNASFIVEFGVLYPLRYGLSYDYELLEEKQLVS